MLESMFTVRYMPKGGFGNSIFGYILCAIYQKIYNYEYVTEPQKDELLIYDNIFLYFFKKNDILEKKLPYFNGNICFCGWFQYDFLFAAFKDEILDFLLHTQQTFYWQPEKSALNSILVNDFLPHLELAENDLVIHLRLDDFIYDKNCTVPWHISIKAYKQLIQEFYTYFKLSPGKLYWVMDKPKMPEEHLHLQYLLTEIGGIYTPMKLEEDFCLLRKTKNLIASRSTFAWTAAALSPYKQNLFLPGYNTSLDQPHESFNLLHEKTFTFDFNAIKCSTKELLQDLAEWDAQRIKLANLSLTYGDQYLLLADCVLRSKLPRPYYPVVEWDQKTLKYFEDILEEWDNPPLIFCNNDTDLNCLVDRLHFFKNKIVLMSHNTDANITEQYAFVYEHPKIHHWFTHNVLVDHPKVTCIPIGKANPTWVHGNQEFFQQIKSNTPPKVIHNAIFACFLLSTNREKREYCQSIIESLGIKNRPITHPLEYFHTLASSYFCICPEGNAVDTHRFWECWYFKTIPICLRTPFNEYLAKQFPCCLIDSWEKLPEQLIPYNESLFTPEVFEKLDFSYYKKLIVEKVKEISP